MNDSSRDEPVIGWAEIERAAERIAPHVHRTPVVRCASLDRMSGASLFFKCENLQKTGSFKARGALHAVLSLSPEEATRGVVTHSSGNHGQALAWAARQAGVAATVVMPRDASRVKRAAVEGYGAEVVLCEPTLAAREQTARQMVAERGGRLVHPYDDRQIVAGQATAALELLEAAGPLDYVVAPVGGGGLLSGTALAVAHRAQGACTVVGAEPAAADDACRSLCAGRLIRPTRTETIADGLRTALGRLPFSIIRHHVERIVTVDEAQIVHAMRCVWSRMKLVIEPSAAVAVAAVLKQPKAWHGRRVGVILSGGNVDLDRLPWLTPDAIRPATPPK